MKRRKQIISWALALILALIASEGLSGKTGATDSVVEDKPTVLVFGLGSRCRYCVELKEEISRVTDETGDAVRFEDIRVDRDRALVQEYRVLLSPTLIFLDTSGTEVFRHQGILNAQQILEHLTALNFWPGTG